MKIVILGRVVVVAIMTILLADDHVSFDRRERLETGDVWRYWTHVGTFAEQWVLARTACRRTRKLLDPTRHHNNISVVDLELQVGVKDCSGAKELITDNRPWEVASLGSAPRSPLVTPLERRNQSVGDDFREFSRLVGSCRLGGTDIHTSVICERWKLFVCRKTIWH